MLQLKTEDRIVKNVIYFFCVDTFEDSNLPLKVRLCLINFLVWEYAPPLLCCYCQHIEHTVAVCEGKGDVRDVEESMSMGNVKKELS